MEDSIFGEFQYFIKRIQAFRNGDMLTRGETIEDLELRFRVQVEKGLVIDEPEAQALAMDILLSDLPETEQRRHLMELRRTGKTDFKPQHTAQKTSVISKNADLQTQREKALTLIHDALSDVGVRAQKQPLGVKMLMAEFELKEMNYADPKDLKLLLVNTVKLSGHSKKADPARLAQAFNQRLGAK